MRERLSRPRFNRQRIGAVARRRLGIWIVLASAVGAVTGLGVIGLHVLIQEVAWGPLSRRGDWWIALLPAGGLLLASLFVHLTHDRSTETTEDYVRAFHDPVGRMPLRSAPMRLLASISTIALGGSMGLEGPSVFLGAAVGDLAERRFRRFFGAEDAKILLVAGAAAGIAAIFKAPVTGIVFALEVPFQDDLARHALISAIFAAASSYLVFVAVVGTEPFFPLQAVPLSYGDLMVSLAVGVACGLGARLFVWIYRRAGRLARELPFWARPVVGGAVLFAVGLAALAVYHQPLPLGPGYNGILKASRGQLAAGFLLLLLAMKMVTTSVTSAGNGVGGLFFPAVMMGASLGGALGHLIPGPPSLFAVVGIAAFLGGSYKVPLAGVIFVAETTGAPGYIIPGLLAAALGYLTSGRASISLRQRFRRRSQLEARLVISVAEAMSREWTEVPPTATLQDFASRYVLLAKARTLPVAEAGTYLGMIGMEALRDFPMEQWHTTPVSAAMDPDHPVAAADWRLGRALSLMQEEGVERLPVVDDGRLLGLIGISESLALGEILDSITEQSRTGLEP